jgi:hypothetical protein
VLRIASEWAGVAPGDLHRADVAGMYPVRMRIVVGRRRWGRNYHLAVGDVERRRRGRRARRRSAS